ncbi:OmpH family outer membrane protein [Betaproteobacteria bacterium PRO7]|jgi:outer membrane protein|nr:OmpH family outer membrane protein [Betaproteobacteria bacterium PRO7]
MKGWLRLASAFLPMALALAPPAAHAQELKLGYVNSERILRDSAPARAAAQKLETEFAKRDRELQDMGQKLKAAAERFEKDAPVLAEAERNKRQRELAEMDRELQRRQREFREDLNQRRNEELQALLDRAQRIVRQIAEQEKFDLIVQDAVFFSPRVDITEKVLRALNNGK